MKKLIKVYVINCDSDFDFRKAEQIGDNKSIKKKAKELNSIFTLEDFQDAVNSEWLNLDNSFILIA